MGAETSSPGQNEDEKHALNCTKLFAGLELTENAKTVDLALAHSRPWKTGPACDNLSPRQRHRIELLRGRNVRVAEQLAGRNRNAIFLSTVTVAEPMFGALRSRKSQESGTICRRFCSAVQLVDLDREAGQRSGLIRADLERRGERIGAHDVLIAGSALARGRVLTTHNVREFGRVAWLQIEDWAAIP